MEENPPKEQPESTGADNKNSYQSSQITPATIEDKKDEIQESDKKPENVQEVKVKRGRGRPRKDPNSPKKPLIKKKFLSNEYALTTDKAKSTLSNNSTKPSETVLASYKQIHKRQIVIDAGGSPLIIDIDEHYPREFIHLSGTGSINYGNQQYTINEPTGDEEHVRIFANSSITFDNTDPENDFRFLEIRFV